MSTQILFSVGDTVVRHSWLGVHTIVGIETGDLTGQTIIVYQDAEGIVRKGYAFEFDKFEPSQPILPEVSVRMVKDGYTGAGNIYVAVSLNGYWFLTEFDASGKVLEEWAGTDAADVLGYAHVFTDVVFESLNATF